MRQDKENNKGIKWKIKKIVTLRYCKKSIEMPDLSKQISLIVKPKVKQGSAKTKELNKN